MKLCSATLNDLPQIMEVEKDSFLPSIQEEEAVFARRIELCPKCFLVFRTINTETEIFPDCTTTDKVIGYISAEFLEAVPQNANELSLNHLPKETTDSSILYISSFAILSEYRGNGNGGLLWNMSLDYFKNLEGIKKIVLLVNEEWKGARHIYEKSGFSQINTFEGFFPKKNPSEKSDGILMELNL